MMTWNAENTGRSNRRQGRKVRTQIVNIHPGELPPDECQFCSDSGATLCDVCAQHVYGDYERDWEEHRQEMAVLKVRLRMALREVSK